MGARIHCLHILFVSFEKMSFEAAIEKSQKNVEFSFQNFQGFLLLFPEGGTGLGLPGHLALLALVEAWRSRGRWVAEGGPPNPFSSVAPSPDVLLLVVPAVTVLTVQPCAVSCFVFFFTDIE